MIKKSNNKTKYLIALLVLLYFIVTINFIMINIFRNEYGIIEINKKMLISINKNDINNNYKKGDLLIISKTDFNELEKDNLVVVSRKEEYSKKTTIIIGKINEIYKREQYIILQNDYTKWNANKIIGKTSKSIHFMGYVFNIISSSSLFFILILLPIIIYLIDEINTWLKNEKQNKEKQVLTSTPVKNNARKNVTEIVNVKAENSISEPQLIETTDVNSIPYFIVPNIEEIKKEESDEELGRIKIKTTIKKMEQQVENKEENEELLEEENQNNDEIEDIVVNDNNQPIEIGKGINNFVLKILELKKYEIYTVLSIIYKTKNIEIPITILKKVITSYVMDKYIQPTDYSEIDFKNRDEILYKKIKKYTEKRKNLDSKQKEEITNSLIFYSSLKEDYSNLEKQIDEYMTFASDNDRQIVIEYIKEKGISYGKLRKMFASKVSATKMFKIVTTETPIPNVLNTQIKSNIKFSKIFSEYVIDKSYKESVVMENMEEVLLKLVGSLLVNELFDFNYTQRYIISFSNSLYSKQRKVKNFTDNFSDPYSQKKILILIDNDTLKNHMRVITELKNKGFNFVIQMKKSSLIDSKFDPNSLNIAEYIIIIGKLSNSEKDTFIPNSMIKRIYSVNEAISSEVITK